MKLKQFMIFVLNTNHSKPEFIIIIFACIIMLFKIKFDTFSQ
jgi:hypothetical protein